MPRRKTKDYVQIGENTLAQGMTRWDFAEKLRVTVPFNGPFAKCISARPARGAELAGFAVMGLRVVSSVVEEMEGGTGKLEVTLEAELPEAEDVTTEAIGEPVFTVSWVTDQIYLENHPDCGYLSPDAIAAGKRSLAEIWDELDANPGWYYAREHATAWDQEKYVQLKQRGIETVPIYSPVVTRTTYHFAKPSDLGDYSGKRQVPPGASGFSRLLEFEWICGEDSAQRAGRVYERRTEWLGALHFEPLIYGDAP